MQIGTGELNALQVWGWEETDAVPPGIRRCHWGSVVFRYQLSSPTNSFCLSYEMRFHILKYQSYKWSWLLIADIAASIHYLRSHYQEAIDIYKRILLDNRLKQLWFFCCFFILIKKIHKITQDWRKDIVWCVRKLNWVKLTVFKGRVLVVYNG